MSYSTQQDILDFVEDNNVKFVRFAFCDIFGTQKNIAVLASDLPKALEDGVCFDGSSIAGFMKVEESDLVLRPDLSTVTILPWRPTEGRVMQFFCVPKMSQKANRTNLTLLSSTKSRISCWVV